MIISENISQAAGWLMVIPLAIFGVEYLMQRYNLPSIGPHWLVAFSIAVFALIFSFPYGHVALLTWLLGRWRITGRPPWHRGIQSILAARLPDAAGLLTILLRAGHQR